MKHWKSRKEGIKRIVKLVEIRSNQEKKAINRNKYQFHAENSALYLHRN